VGILDRSERTQVTSASAAGRQQIRVLDDHRLPISAALFGNVHKSRGLDPARFNLRTVPALLAKSAAWGNYCEGERPLFDAFRKVVAAAKAA